MIEQYCIIFSSAVNVDYSPVSGSFNFSPGDTLRCVGIAINDDPIPENDECFTFRITAGAGVILLQSEAPVCIIDNDLDRKCRLL